MRTEPFSSPAEMEEFFRACDALNGPANEPDLERAPEDHRRISPRRRRGVGEIMTFDRALGAVGRTPASRVE